ncbi:hypothetical protein ACJ6WF_16840 [Streptomyces sp. MMS24-I2-30]|uniref:hypothetical protein n=1 Tax=Streptomyces sp. MMS24-I2-30 TaxID=3351564 RepID=UPI003896A8D8
MSATVRQLRPVVGAQPDRPAVEHQPIEGQQPANGLGGDCICGRGLTIGTCIVSASRLLFRAFHEAPAAYHLGRVLDWACVDCVADAALDVANGVIREQMREESQQRAVELDALRQRNEMREERG